MSENLKTSKEERKQMAARFWCWMKNLRHWKTARAVRDLEQAFWKDNGFVLTWKCQIAMTLIDHCGLDHGKANECADELMRALFRDGSGVPKHSIK